MLAQAESGTPSRMLNAACVGTILVRLKRAPVKRASHSASHEGIGAKDAGEQRTLAAADVDQRLDT
jgi:hypothetical protein